MRKLSYEEIQASKPSAEEVGRLERSDFYALLDNVRSLHNVGAIFRTSDAVMLKKLFLCGITGHPPRKEITKTALGAEELVPYEYYDDATEAVEKLKKAGIKVVAVELCEGGASYEEFEYEFPCAFVFGHEVEGVSEEVIELCDDCIHLPMYGRANSLNVATCYGIIMYEALKHLKGTG